MAKLLSSVLPLAMLACLLMGAVVNAKPKNSTTKSPSASSVKATITKEQAALTITTKVVGQTTHASTSVSQNATTSVFQNTTTKLHALPDAFTVKNSVMGLIIFAAVVGFAYIAFSNWRTSKRRNRLRSFRGAREKMEMAPLGKHADDPEDDTIFDMARA